MTRFIIKHRPARDVTVFLPARHTHHVPESWVVVDLADKETYGFFESEEEATRFAKAMAHDDEPAADYSA